ncbi:MAG: histone deacetylase [Candidatus Hydrogenedentes bacterium]|nr:histone deacetylase [Candidatus Hydrogenedentota bacterium]
MARTGYVFRKEGLLHDTGPGHVERIARLEAVRDAFAAAKLNPPEIASGPASREDLLRIHREDHIAAIEKTCAEDGDYPDVDTTMGKGSWEAALTAAGAAIGACRAVVDNEVDNAFVAVRPPGHHAEADHAMGFCLFNNVAIAARWLQVEAGIKKIAILDWDVHHGNGTQHSFYEDDTVYYASIHQHPLFPGTGFPSERGKNNTNLNVQMTWGNGPGEWIAAMEKHVLPEFARFDPDFLLISCGFDAHRLDPLASQRLDVATFVHLTEMVKPIAGGKIVSVLEGGYHLEALAESAVAHFKALQA